MGMVLEVAEYTQGMGLDFPPAPVGSTHTPLLSAVSLLGC